jgi:hypothetical protein
VQPVFKMSDRLWERITVVLETVDTSPPANARSLLDAVSYRTLSDVAWEALPAAYPPPAK